MRTLVAALSLLLLFGLSACGKKGSTADALRFNNGLVDANKRVTDASRGFAEAAGAAIDGGIEQVAKAKREYEKAEEAFDRAQSDIRQLKVPGSPEAQVFLAEHEKLLKLQEKIVKEEFKAIVKVLGDPLLSANDRRKRIVPIARYIESMDQGSAAGIKQAQAAFARAHGFQLK